MQTTGGFDSPNNKNINIFQQVMRCCLTVSVRQKITDLSVSSLPSAGFIWGAVVYLKIHTIKIALHYDLSYRLQSRSAVIERMNWSSKRVRFLMCLQMLVWYGPPTFAALEWILTSGFVPSNLESSEWLEVLWLWTSWLIQQFVYPYTEVEIIPNLHVSVFFICFLFSFTDIDGCVN